MSRAGPVAVIAVAILVGTLIAPPPASAAQATQIAAGEPHTCALTAAGGVKCWGSNRWGELGDGTTHLRLRPVGVTGLASGITQISAGDFHTCALTSAGAVKCWGSNNYGELGDGTTHRRLRPVDVAGLASGVTQISAGFGHTCALTAAGAVKCWGSNGYGRLGDDTTHRRLRPVNVTGLASGITQISAGTFHTCALTAAGAVTCWGRNDDGQLGDNSTTERHTPVGVTGLASGVTQISTGGFHTCALIGGGAAKCWGDNDVGQLGDNSIIDRRTPVDVTGLASGVTQISAGAWYTCALTAAGAATCWGYNAHGQLGDNSRAERHTPVGVTGLASGVTQISAGVYHTCALTAAGAATCWGDNLWGQLGDNSRQARRIPVFVQGFGGIRTTIALRSSRPRAHAGQKVTYTARINPTLADGLLTFADAGRPILGCKRIPVVNGRARCTVRYTKAGRHRIAALYLGSVVHKASTEGILQIVR